MDKYEINTTSNQINVYNSTLNIVPPVNALQTSLASSTLELINSTMKTSMESVIRAATDVQVLLKPVCDMSLMYQKTFNSISSAILEFTKKMFDISFDIVRPMVESFKIIHDVSDKILFMEIADEIGFPIYLEANSILRSKLIDSYRENNNSCNVDKMKQIIMDYYDDDYIDGVLENINNVCIFNNARIALLSEGVGAYKQGYYGCAGSLFATQLSGMIRDLYDKSNGVLDLSFSEKQEIKEVFKLENCKNDSEKVMLAQIISIQDGGIFTWYRVIDYFLGTTYGSGKRYMSKQPKRHMICHGIQTNYNTKEMNLKLILCMDIITELAWKIKEQDENSNVVATI